MAMVQQQSEKVYLKKPGRMIFGSKPCEIAKVVQCDAEGHWISLILARNGNPLVIPVGHENVGASPIFSANAVMSRRPPRRRRK